MDLIVEQKNVFAFTHGRDFDAAQPTMLFLHGAGMDHSVWTLQARYFAHHGANALALDFPGHGRSDGPALGSIEAMAAWLAALIEALGIDDALLIGHSMGALVGLEAAFAHQDRVRGLALLGAAPVMPVHPGLLEAARSDLPLAAALVSSWAHGTAGRIGGNRAPGGWLMGHALKLLERSPKGVLHNDLAACNAYQNGMAAAAAIRCPTLVITGEDDRMTPARQGTRLKDTIAGANLAEIRGSGHLMPVENPDATLDALIAWSRSRP